MVGEVVMYVSRKPEKPGLEGMRGKRKGVKKDKGK
jgi:hypothetical protein